jgi:hypothetical protein
MHKRRLKDTLYKKVRYWSYKFGTFGHNSSTFGLQTIMIQGFIKKALEYVRNGHFGTMLANWRIKGSRRRTKADTRNQVQIDSTVPREPRPFDASTTNELAIAVVAVVQSVEERWLVTEVEVLLKLAFQRVLPLTVTSFKKVTSFIHATTRTNMV